MKKIILFVFIFLFFLIAIAPARILFPYMFDTVVFNGLSGSIWQGKANSIDVKGKQYSNVTWDNDIWQFFTGKLAYFVQYKNDNVDKARANIIIGFSSKSIHDADVYIPASDLAELIKMPGIELDGNLTAHINTLQLKQDNIISKFDLKISWQDAHVKTALGQAYLGTLQSKIEHDGKDSLQGELKEVADVLRLDSKVILDNSGSISLIGKIRQDLPDSLNNIMKIYGRPDGKGYYNLVIKQQIPSLAKWKIQD